VIFALKLGGSPGRVVLAQVSLQLELRELVECLEADCVEAMAANQLKQIGMDLSQPPLATWDATFVSDPNAAPRAAAAGGDEATTHTVVCQLLDASNQLRMLVCGRSHHG
jgi:hypothetical protein